MNLTFSYLRELILFAFLRVVGIRLGLTFELRQRVHAVSELTSKE